MLQIPVLSILLLSVVAGAFSKSTESDFNGTSGKQLIRDLAVDTFFNVRFENEIYTEKNLEKSRLNIHHVEKLDDDEEYILNFEKYMAVLRFQAAIYKSPLMHRYDEIRDLKLSGGPQVNQEKCLNQLEQMIRRSTAVRNGTTRDLSIRLLMDTYGRVPAGVRGGYLTWTGRYEECKNFKLIMNEGATQSMRYCLADMKNSNWTSMGVIDEVSGVETSVCLPDACDSLDFKDKYKLVEKLIHLNDHEFVARGLTVSNLYCLPDEKSELRQWWKSPITFVLVNLALAWLFLVVFATYIHELNESQLLEGLPISKSSTPSTINKIFAALALTKNFKMLFSTGITEQNETNRPKADLRSIDGIKVICMLYIIIGHVLSCFSLLLKNGQDHFAGTSLAYYVPYLVPAFAVNGFFVITGILTSYIIFSENRSRSFLNKPASWLFLLVQRYLRVMPTYLVAALFAKHVGRYIGSGPFWDYGTSSLSLRWMYEREPISWVLLFGANLKFIHDHCLTSAWYLANDFQFFLVTPIFISLLHRSSKVGQAIIYICMALGTAASSISFLSQDIDYRPPANFEVHSMMYLITYLNGPYVYPIYRIPSYLLGIIIGYKLYKFVGTKLKRIDGETCPEHNWSPSFIKFGPTISLLFIFIQCATPFICSRMTFTKFSARVSYSVMAPLGYLIFAWSIGSYVLLAATGYGNRLVNSFLSLSVWKPLARLSLCAFLVQMEVIHYFVQTSTEMQDLVTPSFAAFVVLCAIVTYLMATLLYVSFEAPVKNLLTIFISRLTSLQQTVQKVDDKSNKKKKKVLFKDEQ